MSKQQSEYEVFVKALTVVAYMAQFKLEDFVTEFWVETVRPHGLMNAAKVLMALAPSIKSGKMPSINDVLEKMGHGELTDASKAVDVVRRLEEAVRKYGYVGWAQAKNHIGPIGERVVGGGGWVSFCESLTEENLPTMRAQWRHMAEVLIQKDRNGTLDKAPQFDSVKASEGGKLLKGPGA